MVHMAELAPHGVFDAEDIILTPQEETPYERHFDDYSRNYEDAA